MKYFTGKFQVLLAITQNCVLFRYAILNKLNPENAKASMELKKTSWDNFFKLVHNE